MTILTPESDLFTPKNTVVTPVTAVTSFREIRIRLTWPEVEIGAQVGMQRNIQCLKEGRKPGAGQPSDNLWTTNIEGAQAEMAVAKHFGVYWSGNIGNYDADDVSFYQVRANLTRRTDCMYLRPWDKPDKAYISVLSFVPDFIICGWMLCRDGRREKWLGGAPGRPPCYCVPRSALHPLSELPVI